jgi:hypothetical protein
MNAIRTWSLCPFDKRLLPQHSHLKIPNNYEAGLTIV